MNDPLNFRAVEREFLRDVLDYLYELKGEWAWKQDEQRTHNSRDYRELIETIEKLETFFT